jgi:hypothetical protein
MFKFSRSSLAKLETCHPDLIRLMEAAIKSSPMDFSIICGYRGEEEQKRAHDDGKSFLKFPESKHNKKPSMAVDIAPYPIDWDNIKRFIKLSEHIKQTAKDLNISIWYGGDWKSLKDSPHYELVSW